MLRGRLEMIVLPVVISLLPAAQLAAQASPDRLPQVYPPSADGWTGWISNPYRPREVSPVSFQNSNRIFELTRAGQLYLSLSDAIALALENNLDVQLERYLPEIARTDVMRAKGGGLLRGLSLLVNEVAPGIGGPNGPLLTNLTAGSTPAALVNTNFSDVALISQQQNDLSVLGAIPMSIGPPIPAVRSNSFHLVELDASIDARIQPGDHRRLELVEFQYGQRKPRLSAGLFAGHTSRM